MANGNSKVFADRFYAQTGANFLSALASIERMAREDRQKDDSFRQALMLQDKRLASQESMQSQRIQHELGLQHVSNLRALNEDIRSKVFNAQEQLKGLEYSSDNLNNLPYYNKTSDGSDMLKDLSNQLKTYTGALKEGELGIGDLVGATEQYNQVLNQRLDRANREVEIAQEVDNYMNTKAPEYYREYRNKNPNSTYSEFKAYQASLEMDSSELSLLRKDLDKKDTPFEGIMQNDAMWNKIVQEVQTVQKEELSRLESMHNLHKGLIASKEMVFQNSIQHIDGEIKAALETKAHWTQSIAGHLVHMKYEDADKASESVLEFATTIYDRINTIHNRHGGVTAFGRHLMESAGEMANAKVSNAEEATRVIRKVSAFVAQAFQNRDDASAADTEIANAIWDTMKSSGILSNFTSQDELINIGTMSETIDSLDTDIGILLKLKSDKFKGLREAGNIPLEIPPPGVTTTDTTKDDSDELDDVEVATFDEGVTKAIDDLYNQTVSYNETMTTVDPVISGFLNEGALNQEGTNIVTETVIETNKGGQGISDAILDINERVPMPDFLTGEWEFMGFDSPTIIAGHEFNSNPLMFRSKKTGEISSNPTFAGQKLLDFEQIGEYKDYKHQLNAIYDARAALRTMQRKLDDVKSDKARLTKNVVNKGGKYYKNKLASFEEEIARLTSAIKNK